MKIGRKALSALLCFLLCLSFVPIQVLAENESSKTAEEELEFSEIVDSDVDPASEETVPEDNVPFETEVEESFPEQNEEKNAETVEVEAGTADDEEPEATEIFSEGDLTEGDPPDEDLLGNNIPREDVATPDEEKSGAEEANEEELFEVKKAETSDSEGEEEEGIIVSENGDCMIKTMEDLKELAKVAAASPNRSFRALSSGGVFTITEDIRIPANLKIDYFSSQVGSLAVAEDITVDNYGTIFWATKLELNGTVINRPGATMTADQWDGNLVGIGAVGYIAYLTGNGTIVNYGTLYLNGASTVKRVENQEGGVIYLKEPMLSSMDAFYEAVQLTNEMPYIYLSAEMREPMNITEDLILPSNVVEISCSYAREGYGLIIGQGVTVTCNCTWEVNTPADIRGTLRNNSTLTMYKAVHLSGVLENNNMLNLPSTDMLSRTLTVEDGAQLINRGAVDAYHTNYSIHGSQWILTGHRVMMLNGSLVNEGSFEVGEVSGYGRIRNSGNFHMEEGCSLGSLENSGTITVLGGLMIRDAAHVSGTVAVNLVNDEELLQFGEGCSYTVDWSSAEALGSITVYVQNEERSEVGMVVSGLNFANGYTAERSEPNLDYTYTSYDGSNLDKVTVTLHWAFLIRPKDIPECPFYPPVDPPHEPTETELAEWMKDTEFKSNIGWTFTSSYGLAALMYKAQGDNSFAVYHYVGTEDFRMMVNIRIPMEKYVYISPAGSGKRVTTIIPENVTLQLDGGHLVVSDLEVYGQCSAENEGTVYGQQTLSNNGLMILEDNSSWFGVADGGYAGKGSFRLYGMVEPDPKLLEGINLSGFKNVYDDINQCHVLTPLATYTVNYDANGGSGAPASQNKTSCNPLILSTKKPAFDGYSFSGWATTRTSSVAEYQPGDSYETDSDLNLFAVWGEQHTHTPGTAVRENEVAATCTANGSYDEVIRCKDCGEEISRVTRTVEKIAHIPGMVVRRNEVTATCTADGSYDEVVCCSACGEELNSETKIVKAPGHDYVNGTCTRCGERETASVLQFEDVANPSDYYFNPVYWAAGSGITSGTSPTTFSPGRECTRGQIVTFLWKAMGSPEPSTTNNPFTDVKPSDYFYKPVLWAKENGITSGKTATTFAPSAACTRGQIVTFLWIAKGRPEPTDLSNPFTDVKTSDYFYKPVLWAKENGITSGTSATTFSPGKTCTRAQAMTFLWIASGRP